MTGRRSSKRREELGSVSENVLLCRGPARHAWVEQPHVLPMRKSESVGGIGWVWRCSRCKGTKTVFYASDGMILASRYDHDEDYLRVRMTPAEAREEWIRRKRTSGETANARRVSRAS